MALDANKTAKQGNSFSKDTYETKPIGFVGKEPQNQSLNMAGAMKRRADKLSKGDK